MITLNQYVYIFKGLPKNDSHRLFEIKLRAVETTFNLSREEINKMTIVELNKKFDESSTELVELNRLTSLDDNLDDISTTFVIEGEKYNTDFNVSNFSVGQFRDIEFIDDNYDEWDKIIPIIAVCTTKLNDKEQGYNGNERLALTAVLGEQDARIFVPLFVSFLKKKSNLNALIAVYTKVINQLQPLIQT